MKNIQTGTVTGVHGTHIFIGNEHHPTIYAHRDELSFSDPHIGLTVQFELRIRPQMQTPVAGNVRRVC